MDAFSRGLTYKRIKDLVADWKHRQACNNQPEQNEISKAKAHVYGICAEELLKAMKLKWEKGENDDL